MTDQNTIAVYDTRARDYADMTDVYNTDDPRLRAFIAACPPNGLVLDLGCGPGTTAAAMARAGLVVEATDASAEMVAMAARQPGVTARQATFDQIAGAALYDGIWANFSLLHAPKSRFSDHLAALRRALKPDGVFHIGMKLGEGEARDNIGRQYAYYTEFELRQHLDTSGFSPREIVFGRGTGLDGSLSDWITVLADG